MKRYLFNAILTAVIFFAVCPVNAYDYQDDISAFEKIRIMVQKVDDACQLIKKEGKKKAYAKMMDLEGPFIFLDTYIWVNSLSGIMEMHPVKPELIGKDIKSLRDITGKLFVLDIIKKAKREGYGWVEYLWPKPGESRPSQKITYVKLLKVKGSELVVCSGIYDISMKDVYYYQRNKK